ncbi:hypothetical protein [Cupriavidus taiwanensis]|nr:hypothetical protein [Cupriavidus taiwanensis]
MAMGKEKDGIESKSAWRGETDGKSLMSYGSGHDDQMRMQR